MDFGAPDADGDGLLDDWEREGGGIDVDNDGVIDLSLFDLGARPDRKDLFLEIDTTREFVVGDEVKALLVTAFDNAPVANPNGVNGIDLHLFTSETGIAAPAIVPFEGAAFPPLFDTIKQANFGNAEDRANPKRLEARRKFVRYCLVFDRTDGNEGGLAENFQCDDFFVNFGYGRDLRANGEFTQEDLDLESALAIMHEMGHALGLRHGGGDDINGKPNYPSIMNYCLTHKAPFNRDYIRLDYSGARFPTLDENALNENLGIGGGDLYENFRMPIGFSQPTYASPGMELRFITLVPLDGTPFDLGSTASLQLNGHIDAAAAQDLNWFMGEASLAFASTPSFGETLEGYNDWANILYALPSPARRDVRNPVPEDGYLEIRDFLHRITTPRDGWSMH